MKKQVLAAVLTSAVTVSALAEVNVYSYRQESLIKPMLEEFTKETGIKVNTVFLKKRTRRASRERR